MSELRNRTGGQTSTLVATQDADTMNTKGRGGIVAITPKCRLYMGGCAGFKNEDIEDIIRSSVMPRSKVVQSSTTRTAQIAKDALDEDPYNIELIKNLGLIYSSEHQHDKAANVMVRGWKRSAEITDATDRFNFLMKLSESSFRNRQCRQAYAVIMDVEEPTDYNEKKAYQLLSCHILAEIKEAPKAMQMFSKAIEGEEFDMAIKIWAACAIRLKQVGALEAAKNALMNKARPGQQAAMDKSRIETVESWGIMSASSGTPKSLPSLEDGPQKWMIGVFMGLWLLLIIYVLYWLEGRSLRVLKIN